MKQKLWILLCIAVLLVGCTASSKVASPTKAVENLFNKYQMLDEDVLNQLDNVIARQNLTEQQKKDYNELIRKQYQNLSFKVKDETADGETAVVTIEIEVYDYARASEETETYAAEHEDEFLGEDKNLSDSLYENYKISKMKEIKERTKYILDIGVTKKDGEWKVNNLSDMERQKIHGLYDL